MCSLKEMDFHRKAGLAVCLTLVLTAGISASAHASVGEIFQPSGIGGCVADVSTTPGCREARSMVGLSEILVSPDGRTAWGVAETSGSVVVFNRTLKNGELKQKPGTAGCVSDDGTDGECVFADLAGRSLAAPTRLAVSPAGDSLYVISETEATIAIFDILADGSLVQKVGTAGCIAAATAGCATSALLAEPTGIAVSPDGRSVYVTDSTLDGVLNFDRLADGSLVAKAGALGCVSEDGSGGDCADGRALTGASDLSISPGSDNVYVSAIDGDAVAVLDRAVSGKITQQSGTGGCVMVDGASSNCTDARALDGPLRVVISPDGENVYVSSLVSGAISVFDRDQGSGALTQKEGTAGCISADGVGGECAIGRAIGSTFDLELTIDGRSLYAASRTTSIEGSVAALSRSVDTGLLSQLPGEEGCVSTDGSDDCGVARAIETTSGLSSSPDGTSLYAASFADSAAAIFDRSPVGPRAAFRQVPPASTRSRKALFKFSSSVPGATFECRIDSKAFAVCGAATRFRKLSRGRHTVAVRAVKNLSPGKASKYSWRVR